MTIPLAPRIHRFRAGSRRLVAAGLALLAVAASLPAQEMAVRFVLPEFDPSRQVRFTAIDGAPLAEPGARLRQVKNTGDFNVSVAINRHGFRDVGDVAYSEPADVALVGDSFAWGWGVEADDRVSGKLPDLIDRRVFNIAAPTDFKGYEALVRHARAVGGNFGRIVVMVTMEDDLSAYGALAETKVATPSAQSTAASLLQRAKFWATANSELYFLATGAVHRSPWLKDVAIRVGLVVDNLAAVPKAGVSDSEISASVARLNRLVVANDGVVLIVPSRALWTGSAEQRAAADHVHRTFVGRLREAGIKVADPRGSFERDGDPLSFHFQNDGHWRPRGHAAAAEVLATVMVEK